MHSSDQDWPLCACGCGEPVPVRKASLPSKGLKRGDPCKFVASHSSRVRILLAVDGRKRCPQCGETKPVEDFHREARRPTGRAVWCKDCMAAKSREWYERPGNAERIDGAAKRYAEANPGARRAAVDRYNVRHRQRHLAIARRSASARRARKRDQFVEHVDAFTVYERDGGACGICGEPADRENFHVDHVFPLVRGGEHSYANVQVAHPSCNARKKDRDGKDISVTAA